MMNNKLVVTGAFIIKDNQILTALRQNTSCDNGFYGLIGGRVENNETVHAALIREIYEEVGIEVQHHDMQLIQVISFKKENGAEFVSFDFIVTKWKGEPFNKEPHKHADIRWVSLDNLPENFIERHKAAYENYKNNIYYSSYGY